LWETFLFEAGGFCYSFIGYSRDVRGNSTFGLALIDLTESGSTLKDGFVSVCVTNGLACDLDRFLN